MKIELTKEEVETAVANYLVSKSFYGSSKFDVTISRSGGATIDVLEPVDYELVGEATDAVPDSSY